MTTFAMAPRTDLFTHAIFFHDNAEDFLTGVGRWVVEGLNADEPVLIVASDEANEAIRERLGSHAAEVTFADMGVVGANPARIIEGVRRFTDSVGGRRTRALGAPMWPGRTAAQTREVIQHEALCNLAFAQTPVSFLCPYDAVALPAEVLAEARRVHPHLWTTHGAAPCPQYDLDDLLMGQHPPALPDPHGEPLAVVTEVGGLVELRRTVRDVAADAGLSAGRIDDFTLAVNEVACNALTHTEDAALVSRVHSADPGWLVIEVATQGCIADPLVGRELRPTPTGGRGLWLVNQLCDVVETRSGTWGSLTRLHIALP